MRSGRSLELKVAVLLAAIAAAVSAALILDTFSGAALARVKEAWSDGTIHARFLSPTGELVAEEWLDRSSGKSRRVLIGGEEGNEITVQDGKRAVTWNSLGLGDVYEAQAFDANDPWLMRSSSLLRFQRLLDSGGARIVGTRSVGTTSGLVVREESGPDEPGTEVEIVLDEATLLPVEATAPSEDGGSLVFRVQSEEVAGAVPNDFYAPERKASIVDRRMRSSDLDSLPFDAYTLASPPLGFWPGTFGVREQTGAQELFKPEPHLFVGYRRSGGGPDPAFELVERAANTDQARAEFTAFVDAPVRSITVGGRPVDVYLLGEGPVDFALNVRGTLISGHAELGIDETLAALAGLKGA